MAEPSPPPEPPDLYSDQFQVTLGPYGAALGFFLTRATPPPPGTAPQANRLATIRMSLQHLKVLTFLLHRQLVQYERETGVTVGLPPDLLNSLRIGREDWDGFWRT
jgi:hypothetical protein